MEEKNLNPGDQFDFREKHWTVYQIHRITKNIERTLEERKVCSTLFLDVT